MKEEIKTVGYKIIFSTTLTKEEIEEEIDDFLKEADARKRVALVVDMTEAEILEEVASFTTPPPTN